LHAETFVFDLAEPRTEPPVSTAFSFTLTDRTTLEARLDKRHTINDLFDCLSTAGIRVLSMRNKSNRLEELFMNLVNENENGAAS